MGLQKQQFRYSRTIIALKETNVSQKKLQAANTEDEQFDEEAEIANIKSASCPKSSDSKSASPIFV